MRNQPSKQDRNQANQTSKDEYTEKEKSNTSKHLDQERDFFDRQKLPNK